GVDCQRAGVDAFGDLQFAHQFQHVTRALDVDLRARALVAHTDLVPAGDVEDAVHAAHRPTHALLVGHVAFVHCSAQPGQVLRFLRATHDGDHLMARLGQLPGYVCTNEASRASQEVFHGVPPITIARIS